MKNPTVSVVIPSYNHEKYVGETIKSILNQTFQDFEIVITDDGSSDNTVNIITEFSDPRIKLFVFRENKGACKALNNCISNSKGKYIAYVSSDDVWESSKLEKQVKFLDKNPQIAAVFTKVRVIDEKGNLFTDKNHFYYSVFEQENRNNYEWLSRFFSHGNCLCHPSALIRKSVYEDIGLYNETMANLPDFEMWIRICLKYNIHIIYEKLTRFRVRANDANASSSANSENRIRTKFEYMQLLDHYLKIDDTEFFLKVFPDAQRYGTLKSIVIPYFLGRIAYDTYSDFKQLWGLETIYDLMQSSEIVEVLKQDYNFKYADFLKISAQADVFNIFTHPEKDNLIREKDNLIREKDNLIREKNASINEKNNVIKGKDITINILKKKDKQFKELNSQISKMTANIYEMQYRDNKGRSIVKRLTSTFPSLYILFKANETGIKNALTNIKGYRSIKNNNLLDIGFYLKNSNGVRLEGVDPILHYMYHGFKEGKKPNTKFDGDYYLNKYKDVKKSRLNPLVHYSLYGIKEGRKIIVSSNKFNINSAKYGNITGQINRASDVATIKGWIAKIGDNNPRKGILKIDNQHFEISCNNFRLDLKNMSINDGYHAFEFIVPLNFVDGKKHEITLFDKETMGLIAKHKMSWSQKRDFTDFAGFLADSLVVPVINAPFREEDKRCFAMMENVAKYLTNLSGDVEKDMLVSVIMPVYNRVGTVESAINSVLNQTYRNIELIIVDDGSDDGTVELIEDMEDDRIVLLRNKSCLGVSKARNKALKSASGKYITYLDSDNTWDPKYVAAIVGAFLELPDAEAIYSGQLLFKGNSEKPFAVRFGSFNRSLLSNRNYIDMNTFCHTRDLYQRLGGFDEDLRRYVDWDLIMRVAESAKMYSIPIMLSNYYYDKADNTITNNADFIHHQELLREKQKERSKKAYDANLRLYGKHSNNVSVVIPSYESLDDIRECINSIMMQGNDWLEIVVVDNASSQPIVDYLRGLENECKIKLLLNNINYGFTYAVNQGIAIAEPDNDIIILNNDAIVTPDAIGTMQKAAYGLPQCGMVVPQQVLPGGTRNIGIHVPYANYKYECDTNLSARHRNIINVPLFHSGELLELSFAPFFCVYIKRDVLDRSVGLDAELGRHYRSDRIFCNYVRHVMNLKIYHISEAIVYHKLQKSTDILRAESDKNDNFDMIFRKNQWDNELASQLGYKTAIWDF